MVELELVRERAVPQGMQPGGAVLLATRHSAATACQEAEHIPPAGRSAAYTIGQ